VFLQVFMGSVLLVCCALLHVAIVAGGIPVLGGLARRLQRRAQTQRIAVLLASGIALLLFAHSVEIWLWAAAFALIGEFDQFATSFYFATVTYTTLGYGDVVLGAHARIFASFSAITGLLTFGISTAFLIGLLTRIMPGAFGEQ
jgi:cation transport ATPase